MTDAGPQHFPAMFDYDDEHIPADVLVRWARCNGDRLVLADLAIFLATCAGLTISLVGGAALVIGTAGTGSAVAILLVGLLIAVAALWVRRSLRGRTGLRGRDIDLVLAHRTEIRFEPWNELAGRGRPVPTWPDEAQLAHRAAEAIAQIQRAEIWTEPNLLDHQLRLDLPETSRQIQVASWHVHRLRRELGPRPSGPDTDRIASEWDTAATHLEHSVQVLRRHVETLDSYRHAIIDRNRQLLSERRYLQLREQSDAAALHLGSQDARHELATEHLVGLRQELEPSSDE